MVAHLSNLMNVQQTWGYILVIGWWGCTDGLGCIFKTAFIRVTSLGKGLQIFWTLGIS